ncbi:rab effector MyRIP isoform X2 [Salarias fasciatus]|uniref:rab effector MyRIP isoform X2 n=1 Tax=Salarias fasciatus TaxID=181472 RepID=UPI001176A7FF|nr:rab effector MyRIP-like isoform X2 [Salarias fasciatus]
MGRKLDLSGLSDHEAEHVLQVVQRDMRLRKKEEERLSELKQELDEEGSRCLLLSRQSCFNQRCCIRCCSPFTFLLNPKRRCRDCHYNVCKACRVYCKPDKAWLCSACQKSRLLKTQSLEWFYTNVKKRFKRFGSAKVLKTLYRKHLAEHSALSELTEGSAYEESVCNEGSVCGSDSTFYRQTEEHSVAETLSVAMRVAEEAIDEAISKAEFDSSDQEKQDEANYLREHRGELIQELAKTIVQKIISRRKTLSEMRADYDHNWTLEHNADPHQPHPFAADHSSSVKHQSNLWRSHSAFSLLNGESPALLQDSPRTLKKDGGGAAMTAWKSVDRLDNAGVSSVLKSPDGNWIALQSAQLSRPGLLTKRKSLVYSALERESAVVSAYEGLGSDSEAKPEPDNSWGAVLQEIHKKMTDSNFNQPDGGDGGDGGGGGGVPSPALRGSRDNLHSDSEGNWKPNKPLQGLFKWKVPAEIRKPSSSRRTSIIDVNFNLDGASEEQQAATGSEPEAGKARRSRKKRRTRKEASAPASPVLDVNRRAEDRPMQPPDAVTPETLTSGASTPEPSGPEGHFLEDRVDRAQEEPAGPASEFSAREDGAGSGGRDGDGGHESMEVDGTRTEDEDENELDEEMRYRLYRLVAQSRLTYFSSTDEELDRAGLSEGEWDRDRDEDMEEDGQRRGEDELDGAGLQDDGSREEEEDDETKDVELAVKVCRLANQANATEFSSTEDELDRAGRGHEAEDGAIDEGSLWTLQAQEAVQLRDLASLVSASQFSSTEDELDRVGVNEGEELWEEGSIGKIDVRMFDLSQEGRESEETDVKRDETDMEGWSSSREGEETEMEGERAATAGREEEEEEDSHQRTVQEEEEDEKNRENEDDAEFDRIISSMLMITLEDMQAGATAEGGGGPGGRTRDPGDTAPDESGGFRGEDESGEDGQAVKDRGREGEDETPESGLRKQQRDAEQIQEGGEGHAEKERPTSVTEGEGKETLETREAEPKVDADEEETRRGGGETTAEQGDGSSCSPEEGLLSPQEIQNRYSAVSLRSITTEVLKVLNATEELLQGVEGGPDPRPAAASLPPDADPKKLDQQFSRLEENVYVAAGSVFSLEAELSDLEECARGISSSTSNLELSFLEEQVAAAAAKVQQSEMQICDISARIAALKSAGLNVDPQTRFTKSRNTPATPVTLDSSRQLRRRLPAPPVKDKES